MKRQIIGGNEKPSNDKNRRLHRHVKALPVYLNVGLRVLKDTQSNEVNQNPVPKELLDL